LRQVEGSNAATLVDRLGHRGWYGRLEKLSSGRRRSASLAGLLVRHSEWRRKLDEEFPYEVVLLPRQPLADDSNLYSPFAIEFAHSRRQRPAFPRRGPRPSFV